MSLYTGSRDYLPLSAAFGGRDMLHNIAQCEVLLANSATDLHGDLSCSRVAGDLVVPPDAGRPGTSILPIREASSIL